MSDGRKTTVLDLGSIERDGVFGELEALLDEGGEFSYAAALLAKDFLSVRGADDCGRQLVDIEGAQVHIHLLISVTVGVTRTSTPE